MTAAELHAELSRRGVYLWAEEGKLRFRAAPGVFTAELKEKVRANRQELLSLLRGEGSTQGKKAEGPPQIIPKPHRQLEPFPLTDVQQGYWLGRLETFELSASAHLYLEIEMPVLEPQRLEAAWNRLVELHPMLRAVVLPDGQLQVFEETPAVELDILDLRGQDFVAADDQLVELRERLSRNGPTLDEWPLFDLRLSRRTGVERVHLSISLLICDALSWRLILRQVSRLYFLNAEALADEPSPELGFRDYVLAQRAQEESADHRRSLQFWRRRLASLPAAPALPLARSLEDLEAPHFVRRQATISAELWQSFQSRAREARVTPTVALATAYSAMLAAWSGATHFLLNMLFFNRLPWHREVDEVVGNFSSTILLEVELDPAASFETNARHLQTRLLEDLDHARVSGVQVLRELQRQRGGGSRHAAVPVVFASTLRLDGKSTPPPEPREESKDESMDIEVVYSSLQTPQVWLDHQVTERDGALSFNWDAVSQLFARGAVRDRFEEYFDFLWRLAEEGEAWTEELRELVDEMPRVSTSQPIPQAEEAMVPAPAEPASRITLPRNTTEEGLAEIWRELLGTSDVGVHDNFFERGGESLMAVRMLARIHRQWGRDLPMSILFEGGTIAHLAAALANEESEERSPLVAIQSSGEGPPFFCIHPVGGSVLCYQPLAEALGKGRPFYGLESLPQTQDESLEAMAQRYLAAIREVQPQGPYLLGGWSFGAVAAFEMARQLRALGEEVRSVVMIDVAPVNSHDRSGEMETSFLLRRFGEDLAALSGVSGFQPSTQDLPSLAQQLIAAGEEMAAELEVLERVFKIFERNYRALLSYVPKTYDGRISLFQGLQGDHGLEVEAGWRRLAAGEMRVVGLAGDHYSIVQRPGVLQLAAGVREEFGSPTP